MRGPVWQPTAEDQPSLRRTRGTGRFTQSAVGYGWRDDSARGTPVAALPARVVLRRCCRHDRVYAATEVDGGRTVLIGPKRVDTTLCCLWATIASNGRGDVDTRAVCGEPRVGRIWCLPAELRFHGRVLAFRHDGSVGRTSDPCVAELVVGDTRTGLLVVADGVGAEHPTPTAPSTVVRVFERVVR